MAVDFTPTMEEYSGQGKFRYWVQMVLPTIYDDSLSYMELLNKVVYVINLAIDDVGAVETNVASLLTAFEQLQQYTNDYFDNLDVQEEVNNKLDEMVESGALAEVIATYFGWWKTPEMYGAVGDGVADDTEAISNCLNNPYVKMEKNKQYKVTTNIDSTSNVIEGNNSKIIYGGESTTYRGLINLNTDGYIKVNQLNLDGGNLVANGLFIYDGFNDSNLDYLKITNCKIENMDNKSNNWGCSGITCNRVVNISAEIVDNIIRNIHKTTTNPGITSASGIAITRNNGNSVINNNIIENITSDVIEDCDGIVLYNINYRTVEEKGTSEICNNQVVNSQGRFVKIQGSNSTICNNKFNCSNIEVMPTFRGVDLQTGGGIIKNNEFIFESITGGASLQIIQVSARDYNTKPNILDFGNNIIKSDAPIPYAGVFSGSYVVDTIINVHDNIFSDLIRPFLFQNTDATPRRRITLKIESNTISKSDNGLLRIGGAFETITQWQLLVRIFINKNIIYAASKVAIYSQTDNPILLYNISITENTNISKNIMGVDWNLKRMSITNCVYLAGTTFIETNDSVPNTAAISIIWGTGSRNWVEFKSPTINTILDTVTL